MENFKSIIERIEIIESEKGYLVKVDDAVEYAVKSYREAVKKEASIYRRLAAQAAL